MNSPRRFLQKNNLDTESLLYQDIVTTSIVENYYNLPLKTLTMFMLAEKDYPNVECLVKTDSDNVLNVTNLEELCDSLKGKKLLGCPKINCVFYRPRANNRAL